MMQEPEKLQILKAIQEWQEDLLRQNETPQDANLDQIRAFLQSLAQAGRSIEDTEWYNREILPGTDWQRAIDKNLNEVDIILLLISADFIVSDYCYGIEMRKALERHDKGEAHVTPVILRPAHWRNQPFSRLQVLPTDGKPITSWSDRDEALISVAEGIRKVIGDLLKERILDNAKIYLNNSQYEDALDTYEQVIRLIQGDPTSNDASLYKDKGDILVNMKRYEGALKAYEEAIYLNPQNASFFEKKGRILLNLRRYEEALEAYNDG